MRMRANACGIFTANPDSPHHTLSVRVYGTEKSNRIRVIGVRIYFRLSLLSRLNWRIMNVELSKEQKVLLALYRLWKEGRKKVRYEDIVVQVFKDYSADFHLKGYPEFPDTGDAVHKPLYDYRKRGMVSASNKMFSLTPHGVAEAEKLQAVEKGRPPSKDS